jgi:signal transduction histidine kinase
VRERGRADELSVWNSGPGLSRERLETLFDEPFIHLKTPGTSSNLGIGLYLARKIVEAHGGRLWAESAAGAWVNFIFTLPKRGMNGLNDIASESRRRRLDSTE